MFSKYDQPVGGICMVLTSLIITPCLECPQSGLFQHIADLVVVQCLHPFLEIKCFASVLHMNVLQDDAVLHAPPYDEDDVVDDFGFVGHQSSHHLGCIHEVQNENALRVKTF